jgi:hypothetical protein
MLDVFVFDKNNEKRQLLADYFKKFIKPKVKQVFSEIKVCLIRSASELKDKIGKSNTCSIIIDELTDKNYKSELQEALSNCCKNMSITIRIVDVSSFCSGK